MLTTVSSIKRNFLSLAEMSYELACHVLEETASLHATGYHFLHSGVNNVEGFLTEHPDFKSPGWLACESEESQKNQKQMLTGMASAILGILQAYGDDAGLAKRLEDFIPNITLVLNEKVSPKKHYKFQTINHNDLHMNNVMYK